MCASVHLSQIGSQNSHRFVNENRSINPKALTAPSVPIPTGLRLKAQQRCWIVKGNSWNFSMIDLHCRLFSLEGFDLVIHIDQQSAHDRRESDFGRFLFGAQALVERLEHWITTG